jgi:hypothetical protein
VVWLIGIGYYYMSVHEIYKKPPAINLYDPFEFKFLFVSSTFNFYDQQAGKYFAINQCPLILAIKRN